MEGGILMGPVVDTNVKTIQNLRSNKVEFLNSKRLGSGSDTPGKRSCSGSTTVGREGYANPRDEEEGRLSLQPGLYVSRCSWCRHKRLFGVTLRCPSFFGKGFPL